MKKISFFSLLALITIAGTSGGMKPSYAHEGEGHASPKRALQELNESKEILGKLSPDTDGHISKASQAVDQAILELSAIKAEPKKV